MTDIVERLRNPLIVISAMVVRIEAAAEIERLEAKIERWQAQSIAQYAEIERLRVENKRLRGWIAPDILELTAEIERLRAALEQAVGKDSDHAL